MNYMVMPDWCSPLLSLSVFVPSTCIQFHVAIVSPALQPLELLALVQLPQQLSFSLLFFLGQDRLPDVKGLHSPSVCLCCLVVSQQQLEDNELT